MLSIIANISRFQRCNRSNYLTAAAVTPPWTSLFLTKNTTTYRHHHNHSHNNPKQPIEVTWEKPRIGWKKLNFDGSSKLKKPTSSSSSSIGGLFRDHNANFLLGYSQSIGTNTTSTMAEMTALRRGLELSLEQGWVDVWVEGDSKALVDAIVKRKCVRTAEEQKELKVIMGIILEELDNCMVTHVYREGNRAADKFAKMGHGFEEMRVWKGEPPMEVVSIVKEDKEGKIVLRNRR